MPDFRIVPFRPWHLGRMQLRPWDAKAFQGFDLWECGRHLEGPDSATIIADDFPAVCFWFGDLTAGVVQVSMASDVRAERFKLSLHKLSKSIIESAFAAPFCRRMEANILLDNLQGERWIKSHGFNFVGVRERWFPDGSDAMLYGRFKP
jgi:hypothetical protein